MRISDWSSDVCSSDLPRTDAALGILRLEPKGSRTHVAMKYAESPCANLPGNPAPMSVRVASEEQWSVQVHHRFRTDMLHPPLPISAEPVKAQTVLCLVDLVEKSRSPFRPLRGFHQIGRAHV